MLLNHSEFLDKIYIKIIFILKEYFNKDYAILPRFTQNEGNIWQLFTSFYTFLLELHYPI